jgi:hypothetical protein
MKQPVIKFEPVHWWILLIALLAGFFCVSHARLLITNP